MRRPIGGLVFAFGVGLVAAWAVYSRYTGPDPAVERRVQRAAEEATVRAAASILTALVSPAGTLDIIDPLHPNRAVGKTYIYPDGDGWQVSGHYRRGESDRWHPWLMSLDGKRELTALRVRDQAAEIRALAAADTRITIEP